MKEIKMIKVYETKGGRRYEDREKAISAEMVEELTNMLTALRETPVEKWPVFMPKYSDDPEVFLIFKMMVFGSFKIARKLERLRRRAKIAKVKNQADNIPF